MQATLLVQEGCVTSSRKDGGRYAPLSDASRLNTLVCRTTLESLQHQKAERGVVRQTRHRPRRAGMKYTVKAD
jgi:hypothetical protein